MIEVRSNLTTSIAVAVFLLACFVYIYCLLYSLIILEYSLSLLHKNLFVSSMRSPMLPTSLYASTLSDHSTYLCSCLSCCQEMTSAQASGLISDPGYIIFVVFETTKTKFKPTAWVSS